MCWWVMAQDKMWFTPLKIHVLIYDHTDNPKVVDRRL